MLHPVIFTQLDSLWGPHSVDRFANFHNRQTEHFNSRFWVPEMEVVDIFTVDWGNENNWWCPPVGLIPRLTQHARKTKATGTLIVPCWPSAPFWPVLFAKVVFTQILCKSSPNFLVTTGFYSQVSQVGLCLMALPIPFCWPCGSIFENVSSM